mmetsp:Transcript_25381/g.59445  ORF Transcript_25381/g.59445 Transcript_25381/m.59445 type:complete len:347 (+) Transcript_25381:1-1041(+)
MSQDLETNDLETTVKRYNSLVDRHGLTDLKVDFSSVSDIRDKTCIGLWSKLFYNPNDNSVYFRTTVNDEDVDVAFCTQDFTRRSNKQLEDVSQCDEYVGSPADVQAVPSINEFPDAVQRLATTRFVHRVVVKTKNERKEITVELARWYNTDSDADDLADKDFPRAIRDKYEKMGKDRGYVRKDLHTEYDLYNAWLICMAIHQSTTDAEESSIAQTAKKFFRKSLKDKPNKRDRRVNYDEMFLARPVRYRDGRLSWPVVLALAVAPPPTESLSKKQLGALLVSTLLLLAWIALLVCSILLNWGDGATSSIGGVGPFLYGGALVIVSWVFLGKVNPRSMFKSDLGNDV